MQTQTNNQIKWHLTAADTDGALMRFEVWVRPGGAVLGRHVRGRSEERFEVFDGTMGVEREGKRIELTRGQRTTIPAGTEHRCWNAGGDELHAMVELEPADEEALR